MAKRGGRLDTFPADQLFKGNGGAHCMTRPVLVD
jgi:arginine deiminase